MLSIIRASLAQYGLAPCTMWLAAAIYTDIDTLPLVYCCCNHHQIPVGYEVYFPQQ